jgi:hypothetical protein
MSDFILPGEPGSGFDARGFCPDCEGYGEHFEWHDTTDTLGLRSAPVAHDPRGVLADAAQHISDIDLLVRFLPDTFLTHPEVLMDLRVLEDTTAHLLAEVHREQGHAHPSLFDTGSAA